MAAAGRGTVIITGGMFGHPCGHGDGLRSSQARVGIRP
jgi:hypothetical protein